MSGENFGLAPKTSVESKIHPLEEQLNRIEAKLDRLLIEMREGFRELMQE